MLLPYLDHSRIEAGCDEAGRGCLAGPVVASAVVLPPDFDEPDLNDSKQLTALQREKLRPVIENAALAWAVAMVSPEEIDDINILNASFKAMNLAVGQLKVKPGHLLIDGNRFRNTSGIPYTCIVGGDARYRSIAAASVLAKTHRDAFMDEIHSQYPEYHWNRNKGYPTGLHREMISRFGISPWHRKTFRLTNHQLSLW